MEDQRALQVAAQELGVLLPGQETTLWRKILISRINELLLNDFQMLVNILYRVDVSEDKLKYILKENEDKDAADTIAVLIIERQLQKIKSRQESQADENINDDEKW